MKQKSLAPVAYEKDKGIVLRRTETAEGKLYLTILSEESGRIFMQAPACKSAKKGQSALAQPFTYLDFSYHKRGETAVFDEGSLIYSFFGLSARYTDLLLATYFAEVMEAVAQEGVPAGEELRVLLKSLYALEKKTAPTTLIKTVFEWKTAMCAGVAPNLCGCALCHTAVGSGFTLDILHGVAVCPKCLPHYREGVRLQTENPVKTEYLLSGDTLSILTHTLTATESELFSFTASDKALYDSNLLSNAYLSCFLERKFPVLAQWEKEILP